MNILDEDFDKGPENPSPNIQTSREEAADAGFQFIEEDRDLV